MADILMILAMVMVAVFAVRWLLRKRQPTAAMQPAMQYAGAPAGAGQSPVTPAFTPATGSGMTNAATDTADVPADFDVEGFVRQAKLNFIRLQAANDRGDMDDIRQFCSPEMVAEIQMQLQERNGQAQETDVMQLNAELIDISTDAERALASVRFSGLLRERRLRRRKTSAKSGTSSNRSTAAAAGASPVFSKADGEPRGRRLQRPPGACWESLLPCWSG